MHPCRPPMPSPPLNFGQEGARFLQGASAYYRAAHSAVAMTVTSFSVLRLRHYQTALQWPTLLAAFGHGQIGSKRSFCAHPSKCRAAPWARAGFRMLGFLPSSSGGARQVQPEQVYVHMVAQRLRAIAASSSRKRLLFVTGAGMSAESGLPTYRGVSGLYNQGITEDGVSIEDAISGEMLHRRPGIAWKYIAQIEESCRGKAPNAGHLAIQALATKGFDVWILTQNVDGLHTLAGSKNVIEIHGNVKGLECTSCAHTASVSDYQGLAYNKMGQSDESLYPKCPECGSLLRPKVVLFGEGLDVTNIHLLEHQLSLSFDAVFSVEVNPTLTEVSGIVDVQVPYAAGNFLHQVALEVPGFRA